MDYYLKIGRAQDLKNLKERAIYRFFEILPGFLSWSALFLLILLSWWQPLWVAIFIIAFSIFWFFRTIYFSFYLWSGYQKMKKNEAINWLEKLKTPDNEISDNESLKTSGVEGVKGLKNWIDIYHLIIFPMYKEPLGVVRGTFQALKNIDFPKDKIIVVLATEERAGESAQEVAKAIKQEFGDKFFRLLITCHPANLPGEIAGHGSNDAWAIKKAKEKIIDPLKIPYKNIITSSFDVDTCVFPKYFSCLTYHYLTYLYFS